MDPSGEHSGLFVSRTAPVGWKQGVYDDPLGDSVGIEGALVELPFMLVGFLWSSILMPMLRIALLGPFAVVRGRRSGAAWIRAVTLYGESRETRMWTTTIDQVDGVLDEIALGLAEGKVVQPADAFYSGGTTD